MDSIVLTQFGMKGSHQMPALLDKHRVILVAGENLRIRPHVSDDRSANKDGLQVAAFHLRLEMDDAAIELTAVSIPLNFDIHEAERLLDRIRHLLGNKDGPGAGPENWLRFGKLPQRLLQASRVEELEHRRTLAPWNHKSLNIL